MGVMIFLLILAFIWILFATIQDLKSREIANWLNFSLIIFALGFRFFYSLFSETGDDFSFFYQGLIGLGIFFALGNILYYSRMFAGGDAKLMIALGAILPLYNNIIENLKFFLIFFIIFLFIGALYGIVTIAFLSFKNFKGFKREFINQLKKNKILVFSIMFLGIILTIIGFFNNLFLSLGILIFLMPHIYLYVIAVDRVCMIKDVRTKNLTEGDWLYKDIKIGKKFMKADWDGLEKRDIAELKKRYFKVKIKQGIPFSPVFLISYILLIIFYLLKIDFFKIFFG